MSEIVNPYIAGAPVTEARMFFGREDVFQWIENSIAGQYADHILVIHGQRRVGKTSVLKQLGNRLPKRYIPVFFDLQGRTHTTLDRFLWWLAREIVRVLKQDRGIDVPLPEKDAFAADIEYFEHRFLSDLKPVLGTDTLLLTFDEFDNLEESEVKEELARPLTDYLRRLMGNTGINFIFSIGSSGRKLENMQAAYTEFFKTALYKKISFLNEDQTRKLVTRPVENVIEYDKHAVARIYQLAGGHPYFTQLICHELFAKCQQSEERLIKEADVESVLDDVVERGTVNLKFVWDEAVDIEKWGLTALAQLDKTDPRAIADYLRKNRVRFSETDLASGLLHLREKDVLTSENRFVIYLLKLWLKKNRPIEQAREELTEINPIANRYIEIGLEFKDSRLYEKAIESFQEALTISKDNIQAQVNIGLVYMDMKAYDKAVIEFEKALIMDDEDVSARSGLCDAHLSLGDSALARGRTKDAVISYQRVLAINTEHTEARQRMAEIARQRAEKALTDGRDEEALSAFTEALKHTPEDPALIARVENVRAEKKAKVLAVLVARSEKEAAAKNWEGAIKSLEEALPLASDESSIQKKISEVKAAQEKARLDALLVKADAAAKSGRWDEAIESLTAVLSAKPDEAVETKLREVRAKQREAKLIELKTQARGFARTERFDEALSAWDAYIALEPTDRETVQAEIEQVKKAQALARSYADAQKAFTKKNYNQAVDLLKDIINQDENYKDASYLLSQAIELRRTTRKWWQSKWAAGVVGAVILFAIGFGTWRAAPVLFAPTATLMPATATATLRPTASPTLVSSPTATALPTTIPMVWTRLNSGQFLPRALISSIVFDPADPGIIYVGTDNAGIYKSIDGGISWQPIHNGLGAATVTDLVIDPVEPNILYAGTSPGGLYLSRDRGETWQFTGIENFAYGVPTVVMLDPLDHQHVIAFDGQGGFYESFNSGSSWKNTIIENPTSINNLVFHPSNPLTMYASQVWGESGVYRSKDGGKTWEFVFKQEQYGSSLIIDQATDGILYNATGSGLYGSYDGGTTWEQLASGDCTAITIDPKDGTTVYRACQDGQVTVSQDGGKTWNKLNNPGLDGITTIAVSGITKSLLVGGPGGMKASEDGGKTWSDRSNGLGAYPFDILIHPSQPSNFYAIERSFNVNETLYQSSDAGRTWNMLMDVGNGLAFDADGQTEYRSSKKEIYASTDGWQTWSKKKFDLNLNLERLIAHPSSPKTLFAGTGFDGNGKAVMLTSTDAGKTWQETIGYNSQNPVFLWGQNGDGIVYVIGFNQQYYSKDNGANWSSCSLSVSGHTAPPDSTSPAVIDPRDSDHLAIAFYGEGIVVSTNGCQSSQKSNDGLGNLFVNTLAIDPNNPDTIYAGTDGGAYISFNSGKTWGQVNDGLLGATVVYSIVVDKDSNVYAATPYGIFKLEGR